MKQDLWEKVVTTRTVLLFDLLLLVQIHARSGFFSSSQEFYKDQFLYLLSVSGLVLSVLMVLFSFRDSIDERKLTIYLVVQGLFLEYLIFINLPKMRNPLIYIRVFHFNNAMILLRNMENILLLLIYVVCFVLLRFVFYSIEVKLFDSMYLVAIAIIFLNEYLVKRSILGQKVSQYQSFVDLKSQLSLLQKISQGIAVLNVETVFFATESLREQLIARNSADILENLKRIKISQTTRIQVQTGGINRVMKLEPEILAIFKKKQNSMGHRVSSNSTWLNQHRGKLCLQPLNFSQAKQFARLFSKHRPWF